MQTRPRDHVRALLLPLLLALTTATGCATDATPEALALRGNVVVVRLPGAAAGASGQCYASGVQFMRPNGTLDLMLNNRYDFFPYLQNLLSSTAAVSGNGPADLRADASMITITGAQVKMTLDTTAPGSILKGSQALKKYIGIEDSHPGWYSPFVVTIEANDEAFSRFEALPREVGMIMRDQWFKEQDAGKKYHTIETVTLHVSVEGFMQDGTIVRSQTVPYPVHVCWGCLVSLPSVRPGLTDDRTSLFEYCTQKIVGPEFAAPCVFGNDEYLPCTYYCHICDQDEGTFEANACDATFCPEP